MHMRPVLKHSYPEPDVGKATDGADRDMGRPEVVPLDEKRALCYHCDTHTDPRYR